MTPKTIHTAVICAVALCVAILVGWDGRLHWDEPGYLYRTAYFDWRSLTSGPVASDFYVPRLLHLGILNVFFSVLGLGQTAVFAVRALYLIFLIGALGLGYWLLVETVNAKERFELGYMAGIFAPIVPWLVGRTVSEIPGLFLTALTLFCLHRFVTLKGRWVWLAIGGIALGCVVLTRNNLVFALPSYVIALLLFPTVRRERFRLVTGAFAVCLGGVLVFVALMYVMGITFENYLGGVRGALNETAPWIAILYFTSLEGGLVFLALPLAFLFGSRRDASFMTVWFILASLPLYILLDDIEARYLLPNIFGLLGLAGVAGVGLHARLGNLSFGRKTLLFGAILLLLVVTGKFSQRFMSYEVDMREVDQIIDYLHTRYGAGGFTLLVPDDHTDFRYLRVAYPDLSVFIVREQPETGGSELFGTRIIRSLEELKGISGPFVYFGFESNFTVANLRSLIKELPIPTAPENWIIGEIAKMETRRPIEESWMWAHPGICFDKFGGTSHYRFAEVRVSPC